MDYKKGWKLSDEQCKIIRHFQKERLKSVKAGFEHFFSPIDSYEIGLTKEYINNNFQLYLLSTMCLYENSLIYDGFNELNEKEKFVHFLVYFKKLVFIQNLGFLEDFDTVMSISYSDYLYETFLRYEQSILFLFDTIKENNSNFKYFY